MPCSPFDRLMPLHAGFTYGPVRSRRLGTSLGVNVLPPNQKVCSFNCPYCQYGWTDAHVLADMSGVEWPDTAVITAAVAAALTGLSGSGTRLDRITLAGHGEPTLHPQFAGLVDDLRALRDRLAPGVPLAVLSNSSTAHETSIRQALARLDERYMKLDAGDEATMRRVNASRVPVETIIEALSRLPAIVIQSMFVTDEQRRIDNTTSSAVGAWLRALSRIRPQAVHLYSLDREPAWPGLTRVPRTRLDEIASHVSELGIEAVVFGANADGSRTTGQ